MSHVVEAYLSLPLCVVRGYRRTDSSGSTSRSPAEAVGMESCASSHDLGKYSQRDATVIPEAPLSCGANATSRLISRIMRCLLSADHALISGPAAQNHSTDWQLQCLPCGLRVPTIMDCSLNYFSPTYYFRFASFSSHILFFLYFLTQEKGNPLLLSIHIFCNIL